MRGSVIDAMRQDWVRTLRSRGLSENRIVFKHVLRNAGGPALSVLAVQFIGLLGGAVIVEQIFALPGLGRLVLDAITQRDYALVEGCVLFIAFNFLVVNLLVDLAYVAIDPRIRLGAR